MFDAPGESRTSRKGWEGGPLCWSRRSGPHVLLPTDHELSYSCTCLPSAAAPRPRPLRCGLLGNRARRVKAAQEAGYGSRGALVGAKRRALTAVLHLGSRTEAASELHGGEY